MTEQQVEVILQKAKDDAARHPRGGPSSRHPIRRALQHPPPPQRHRVRHPQRPPQGPPEGDPRHARPKARCRPGTPRPAAPGRPAPHAATTYGSPHASPAHTRFVTPMTRESGSGWSSTPAVGHQQDLRALQTARRHGPSAVEGFELLTLGVGQFNETVQVHPGSGWGTRLPVDASRASPTQQQPARPPCCTDGQRQYLPLIHDYTNVNRRPPAETDVACVFVLAPRPCTGRWLSWSSASASRARSARHEASGCSRGVPSYRTWSDDFVAAQNPCDDVLSFIETGAHPHGPSPRSRGRLWRVPSGVRAGAAPHYGRSAHIGTAWKAGFLVRRTLPDF